MKHPAKKDFPVEDIRQLLEPGPVVLVSSAHKGKTDIMTMGWHCVMEFTPSLIGCIIASSNHSFKMIRKSGECVINIPSAEMVETVINIGNSSGEEIDKFKEFGLTAKKARKVKAPLIAECFASLECRVADEKLIKPYNFFILEVVKAHVTTTPKYPTTLHYRGQGKFMQSGDTVNHARQFTKWKNQPNF